MAGRRLPRVHPAKLDTNERNLIDSYRNVPDDDFRYWLCRIASQLCIMEHNDRGRREMARKYPEDGHRVATDEEKLGWRALAVAHADHEERSIRRAGEHYRAMRAAAQGGGTAATTAAPDPDHAEPGELAKVIPLFGRGAQPLRP